jgi:hypothetical protein
MKRILFLHLMDSICAHYLFFIQRKDVATKFGLSSIQNCALDMNMFAYGIKINVIDGYCKLGSNTIMESMKWFVKVIKTCFESKYLR